MDAGEFDFGGTPANHAAQFGALVDKFRADLTDMAGQCVGGSAGGVPWICGDTTYFWKQKNESSYQTVYGSYKNKTEKNIHFVPFMTDENGVNVPTNKPEEDPDIPGIGYYGSKWRDSSATGRHRTGRAISVHGLAAGLFPTVWQRRFCAMREEWR